MSRIHFRSPLVALIFSFLFLFHGISHSSYSQQTIDTGWKVLGKDVLKKDTTGKVVIGDMNIAETTEKLNIKGNIRLDGLRGNFDRDVYVDKEGILRADKKERPIGGGGMPEDIMAKLKILLDGIGNDGTPNFGPNREECGFFVDGCNLGVGTKKPLKKLHVFTDHAPSGVPDISVAVLSDKEEEVLLTPDSDPGHHSHFGIRMQDRGVITVTTNSNVPSGPNGPSYTSVINEEIWDFEPIADDKLFKISKVNFNTGIRYNFLVFKHIGGSSDNAKNTFLYGNLEISKRLHVKESISSGDKLIFSGGKSTSGKNFIYSTDGILSFGKGTPGSSNTNFSSMKIGIGIDIPLYNLDVSGDIHATGNTIIDGNVGIGTIPSQYKFDVKGDIHAVGKTILEGNVEIGTNSSPYKFDVYGDIHATGNVKFDGDLCLQYIKCNSTEPFHVRSATNPDLYFYMGVNRDLDQDPNHIGDGKIDIGGFNKGGGTVEEKLADLILQPFDLGTAIGGKVGIGTSKPEYTLDVYGAVRFRHRFYTGGSVGIGTTTPSTRLHVVVPAGEGILSEVPDNLTSAFLVRKNGIAKETFKVRGDGNVFTTNVWISESALFPDYVFEDKYKKQSMEEIRDFTRLNKHLPGIPSAKEVTQNGMNVGLLQVAHLKSTEELYLHVFDLKDELEALKEEMKQLREENKELKELIGK